VPPVILPILKDTSIIHPFAHRVKGQSFNIRAAAYDFQSTATRIELSRRRDKLSWAHAGDCQLLVGSGPIPRAPVG